jgi:uncharacterized protein
VTLRAVVRDSYSAPFFDAARRGELVMPRCANAHFMAATQGRNGPAVRCHQCLSADIDWAPVSGRGVLISWTVLHLRGEDPPTRIAGIVELDEGPWLKTLIDAADDSDLQAGRPMSLGFVATGENGEGEPVPAYRPA